jgi:RNA polymerase sigma-70 factor (ECF subfamily)
MNVTLEEVSVDVASLHESQTRSDYLVSAAQGGSSAAFGELREIYSRRVYRTLLTITRNREDAEDASQDAFMRAYLALHTFEGRSSFYSWLTRIAINSALVILRRRRARPEISIHHSNDVEEENSGFEFKDITPSPEHICVHRERYARVLRSIERLQPRLRQVIELQMKHNLSVKEIARALKISEAAVKSRLYRARTRLISSRVVRSSEVQAHDLPRSLSAKHAA